MFEALWLDGRFSIRTLLKVPGFTLIALLTLSLGIGVNTAVFAGFNLLLRPRPIKDPDTLVRVESQSEDANRNFSYPAYEYLRQCSQTLAELLPTIESKFLLDELTPGAAPVEARGIFATDDYLSSLGGTMQLGRFFTKEENLVEGRDAVVVLSHYFWRDRMAGERKVVGRSILLNGKSFTVIGVTSPDFAGLQMETPDLWLPLMMRSDKATSLFEGPESKDRDWFRESDFQWLSLHARLRRGKTIAEAERELAELQNRSSHTATVPGSKQIISVVAFGPAGTEASRIRLAIVLSASGIVLLIACSNIANMLLARAVTRQKEIGVRFAMGASRGQVIRQLMTESFLLAIVGGLAGSLFAWQSAALLFPWVFARYNGGYFARTALRLSPDWRVVAFALVLSLLSGIAVGVIPALRATSISLSAVLSDNPLVMGGRLIRSRLRNGLVVVQVALCMMLLIPAGLLLRAMTTVFATDRGYDAEQLLVVEYGLDLRQQNRPSGQIFHQQMIKQLAGLPGVRAVCSQAEFGGRAQISLLSEQNDAVTTERRFDQVPFYWVTAGYLETIGTPLILGRGFTSEEVETQTPVIIVSAATAQNLWPAQNPLGKTLRVAGRLRDGKFGDILPVARVIGVARNNQTYRAGYIPPLFFYAPRNFLIAEFNQVLVRTSVDIVGIKDSVRRQTASQGFLALLNVTEMKAILGEVASLNATRIASELALILSSLALLLAMLGLYGVTAFAVTHRTREIGIRLALGATPAEVQRMVIAQGMQLIMLGLCLGVPFSMAASRVMKSLLFGVSIMDPLTYCAVAFLLGLAGLSACWLPARHASTVNPLQALRHE